MPRSKKRGSHSTHSQMKSGKGKTFKAGKSNFCRFSPSPSRSVPDLFWTPGALGWFMPWKLFLKCGFSLGLFSAHCPNVGQKSRRGLQRERELERKTPNTKLSRVYKLAWHELLMIWAMKWTTAAPPASAPAPPTLTGKLTNQLADILAIPGMWEQMPAISKSLLVWLIVETFTQRFGYLAKKMGLQIITKWTAVDLVYIIILLNTFIIFISESKFQLNCNLIRSALSEMLIHKHTPSKPLHHADLISIY